MAGAGSDADRLARWRPATFTALLRGQTPGVRPAFGAADDERPVPGPDLDRKIDEALELLASVPFEELQERGWHFQPNHFYWPLNDLGYLREHPELWRRRRPLHGIDLDIGRQEELVRRLAAFAKELSDVETGPSARPGEFRWDNVVFPTFDAYLYYGVVRELEPRRVVEVGAGWSSLLLARAAAANERPPDVTLIEPYPDDAVLAEVPAGWNTITELVQQAPLSVFDALEPGDVLFYDGSHAIHTGSDLNWMVFDVLPRLAQGVWVHFHDIAWPLDYSIEFVVDEGLSWNEQYLLEALLTGNPGYTVRLGACQLLLERWDDMRALFGEGLSGASLWLEKTGA
jgi:predicted O-methyltransferase YrrM